MDPQSQLKLVRQGNMKLLLRRYGDSPAKVAAAVGKSAAQVHQWLVGIRSISEGSARAMERKGGLPPLWFDAPQDSATPAGIPVAREEMVKGYVATDHRQWPFETVSPERFARLPERLRGRIDAVVEQIVVEYESGVSKKSSFG